MESTPVQAAPRWSGVARAVRGDELVEEASAGFAAEPDGPPCSADLRYQAGSISKLVLAVVVLVLNEADQLDLDRPVCQWLDDAPRQWDAITLRHLIGQTSGLGHWGDVPDLGPSYFTDPPARDELIAKIRRAPVVSAPGQCWAYSGPGFLVAALVIEAVTGSEYGLVATDLVIRPAQMRATTSGRFPDLHEGTALAHRAGRLLPVHEGFTQIPGTGDIWTTVEDLVSLNQALRADHLLPRAVAAQLWTPHTTIVPADTDQVVSIDGYGYGTFLGRINGSPARINPGDNPGYQSLLAYLPEQDLDVVVLCNDEAPSTTVALNQLTSV